MVKLVPFNSWLLFSLKLLYIAQLLLPHLLQFSFLSNLGCIASLGMAFGAISDDQISASSQQDGNHTAVQARLYFKGDRAKTGGWSALRNDLNQWLQVDFGSYTRVTRVATQGIYAYDQWVTKYRLQYSNDGMTFQVYKQPGEASTKVSSYCNYSIFFSCSCSQY